MKRLGAIIITIAVFAAIILPTSAVMASWQTFYESIDAYDDITGAEGAVWGSYNPDWDYISTSMRVEPLYWYYRVEAYLMIDTNGDGIQQSSEPYVHASSREGPWGTWTDPLVLTYSGMDIPSGAIVHYVVHTFNDLWGLGWDAWGTAWHL